MLTNCIINLLCGVIPEEPFGGDISEATHLVVLYLLVLLAFMSIFLSLFEEM